MTQDLAARRVNGIDAVTFDFYETLAHHPDGGRGARLMAWFEHAGLSSDPWQHEVLYDVFEPHAREYAPAMPVELKREYFERFADRLFNRLNVRTTGGTAAQHAPALWKLLGPSSLALFPEVPAVLRCLRRHGLRIAVLSNWQCGLGHFCTELGIGSVVDAVIASAEVGAAKPDPAIFAEAARRLDTPPERIVHVGDTYADDVEGATHAGFRALWLRRNGDAGEDFPAIDSLTDVPLYLGLEC